MGIYKYNKAIDIVWETDGEEIDLPTEVKLPDEIDVNDEYAVTDYLSDEYGWLVISYNIQLKNNKVI